MKILNLHYAALIRGSDVSNTEETMNLGNAICIHSGAGIDF